ncbi:HNH endonuclease signature motif containing protein [Allocatelliglobosispora scoriae]
MTQPTKDELWFASEPEPRCYLCGYKFTPAARDYFLGRSRVLPTVSLLVDFTRPRLKVRHLQIEIDHVQPVVDGGSNEIANLRLACGLCNIIKSRFGSIYDTYSWPVRHLRHPDLGWVTIPQPLWLLRVLSLRARCEYRDGCAATVETHEMFAAPWSVSGSLNPVNIKVCCSDHDPWASKRLIRPSLLA